MHAGNEGALVGCCLSSPLAYEYHSSIVIIRVSFDTRIRAAVRSVLPIVIETIFFRIPEGESRLQEDAVYPDLSSLCTEGVEKRASFTLTLDSSPGYI